MARYIDAELLKENFAKRLNNRFGITIKIDDAAMDLGLAIADTPTADVVEAVRCKDCNNYEPYTIHTGWCNEHRRNVLDNNYCGFAERKDADGKD